MSTRESSPGRQLPPIGGYFGLELSGDRQHLPQTAGTRVQSARAALRLLLEQRKPAAVWSPSFVCDAILSPIRDLGIEIRPYPVANDLSPALLPSLRSDEMFLCVDYFGVCGGHIDALLETMPRERVIVDNAQAFYSAPRPDTAAIYSPRKFFGIPDGGLLVTASPIPAPAQADERSHRRARYLLDRTHGMIEVGLRRYRAAERSLAETTPLTMSVLTQSMLDAVDFAFVAARRRQNFRFLDDRLAGFNRLSFSGTEEQVPLCYPLWLDQPADRARLAQRGIFLPRYWPEVEQRSAKDSVEWDLATNCVPLPCDQRYTPSDMLRMIDMLDLQT